MDPPEVSSPPPRLPLRVGLFVPARTPGEFDWPYISKDDFTRAIREEAQANLRLAFDHVAILDQDSAAGVDAVVAVEVVTGDCSGGLAYWDLDTNITYVLRTPFGEVIERRAVPAKMELESGPFAGHADGMKCAKIVTRATVWQFLRTCRPKLESMGGRAGRGLASSFRLRPGQTVGNGLFALERELSFNVLDRVEFDPKSGRLTLIGHRDPRYSGPKIPYLQHLATLLEYPKPEFSLRWTPESGPSVDRFADRDITAPERKAIEDKVTVFMDENGAISAVGKTILPSRGFKLTRNGSAPGHLGVRVSAHEGGFVDVVSVEPRSPADAAGIRAGDMIIALDDESLHSPVEFDRWVRFMAAGAKTHISIQRNGEPVAVDATLAPFTGDPWQHVDAWDVVEHVFRSEGKPKAADLMHAFAISGRSGSMYVGGGQRLEEALELPDLMRETMARVESGELTHLDGARTVMRKWCQSFDRIMEIPNGGMVQYFDDEATSMTDVTAMTSAVLKKFAPKLLDQFWVQWAKSPQLYVVPPTLIQSMFGVINEVVPEYTGIDPRSQIARVMFHADYISKHLINAPQLKARISKYQSEFEFDKSHPDKASGTGGFRLWYSVDRIDAAQHGTSLQLRGASMRVNIRKKAPGGGDLPAVDGGYDALLTSIYDDLSREFPILHELRECAKLSAAAKWMLERDPKFRLPTEGRVAWNGPARLPGALYLYILAEPGRPTMSVAVHATGGVSLTAPSEVIPDDPSLPAAEAAAREYTRDAMKSILRQETQRPYRPDAWVLRPPSPRPTLPGDDCGCGGAGCRCGKVALCGGTTGCSCQGVDCACPKSICKSAGIISCCSGSHQDGDNQRCQSTCACSHEKGACKCSAGCNCSRRTQNLEAVTLVPSATSSDSPYVTRRIETARVMSAALDAVEAQRSLVEARELFRETAVGALTWIINDLYGCLQELQSDEALDPLGLAPAGRATLDEIARRIQDAEKVLATDADPKNRAAAVKGLTEAATAILSKTPDGVQTVLGTLTPEAMNALIEIVDMGGRLWTLEASPGSAEAKASLDAFRAGLDSINKDPAVRRRVQ